MANLGNGWYGGTHWSHVKPYPAPPPPPTHLQRFQAFNRTCYDNIGNAFIYFGARVWGFMSHSRAWSAASSIPVWDTDRVMLVLLGAIALPFFLTIVLPCMVVKVTLHHMLGRLLFGKE